MRRAAFVGALLATALCAGCDEAAVTRLPPQARAAFARIPVQEGGRVKPLSTVARFRVLKLRGATRAKTHEGPLLDASEWLARVLLWPGDARKDPVFLVQNDEVLDAIGLAHAGKRKRDRYTWEELSPARTALFQRATEYQRVPPQDRSVVQLQVVHLAENLHDFEQLVGFLEFARADIPFEGSRGLEWVFGEGKTAARFTDALTRCQELVKVYRALAEETDGKLDAATRERELAAMDRFVRRLEQLAGAAQGLAICPPAPRAGEHDPRPAHEVETWLTPAGALRVAFERGPAAVERETTVLRELEHLARAAGDPAVAGAKVESLERLLATFAAERGEGSKLGMEVSFYRAGWFGKGLAAYLVAFVLVSLSWLVRPTSLPGRLLGWGTLATCGAGLALHVIGIGLRCVLRGRPPVTTLYETILFISAGAVVVALVIERLHRQRLGLSLAPALGAAGLFLADRYEAFEGTDTMPALVAVLDTNFWLSTHVTTVTLGYSAGLLAGFIAHLWVLGRVFAPLARRLFGAPTRLDEPGFYRDVSRLTYGVICFGLFFSVIGTILGGVWANYSWGRFWGWDPKENGALLIVLWELAILHARMGGWLRERGICLAAILGNTVVGFSWWGVNLLNTGLHSYGFTAGVKFWVEAFYWTEVGFVLLGLAASVWWPKPGALAPAEPAPAV